MTLPAAQIQQLLLVCLAHRRPLVRLGDHRALVGGDVTVLDRAENLGHGCEALGRLGQPAGLVGADAELVAHRRRCARPLELAVAGYQSDQVALRPAAQQISLAHQAQQLRSTRLGKVRKRKTRNSTVRAAFTGIQRKFHR